MAYFLNIVFFIILCSLPTCLTLNCFATELNTSSSDFKIFDINYCNNTAEKLGIPVTGFSTDNITIYTFNINKYKVNNIYFNNYYKICDIPSLHNFIVRYICETDITCNLTVQFSTNKDNVIDLYFNFMSVSWLKNQKLDKILLFNNKSLNRTYLFHFDLSEYFTSSSAICIYGIIKKNVCKYNFTWCFIKDDIKQLSPVKYSDIHITPTSSSILLNLPKNHYAENFYGNLVYVYNITVASGALNIFNMTCVENKCSQNNMNLESFKSYTLIVTHFLRNINTGWRCFDSLPTEKNFTTFGTYPSSVQWLQGAYRLRYTELDIILQPLPKAAWHDREVCYIANVNQNGKNTTIQCKQYNICNPVLCTVPLNNIAAPFTISVFSKNSFGRSMNSSIQFINPKSLLDTPAFDVEKVDEKHGYKYFKLTIYVPDSLHKKQFNRLNISLFACASIGPESLCKMYEHWKKQVLLDSLVEKLVNFHVNISIPTDKRKYSVYFSTSLSSGNMYSGLSPSTKCYYDRNNSRKEVFYRAIGAIHYKNHIALSFDAIVCEDYSLSKVSHYTVNCIDLEDGVVKQRIFPGYLCTNVSRKRCKFNMYSEPEKSYECEIAVSFNNGEFFHLFKESKYVDKFHESSLSIYAVIFISLLSLFFLLLLYYFYAKSAGQFFRSLKKLKTHTKPAEKFPTFNSERVVKNDDSVPFSTSRDQWRYERVDTIGKSGELLSGNSSTQSGNISEIRYAHVETLLPAVKDEDINVIAMGGYSITKI